MTPTYTESTQSFFGWRMVAVAFLVDFIAVGFFFYSYGVFFKAIAAEFGGSRFGVAIGITLTQAVGAILAPFIGRALDRYPLKRIMAAGAVSMGLGFSLLSLAETAMHFYLILSIFIGFGAGAMGQLATSKLVSNWFVLKRGMALGIAATGISVSGVVMPTISAYLVTDFGWRQGFLVYGLITLILFDIGIVVKLVSEAIDAGEHPYMEAGMAAGGTQVQINRGVVLAQSWPFFTNQWLYVLELNVRISAILGVVGAGGIGRLISERRAFFAYDDVGAIVLEILVVVIVIELFSNFLRRRLT